MDHSEKKIIIIAPALQMGGIERSLSTLANYFAMKGHKIYFIALYPFVPFFELDKTISFYPPPYPFPRTGRSYFQTAGYYLKMFSPFNGFIRLIVKEVHPDVILSFGDWFPHAVMLQLKDLKIPFYYSNRSNPNIRYHCFFEFIRKLAYTLSPPAGVIAQTSAAFERKQRLLGESVPIKIIPNPVRKINVIDRIKENWIVSVGRLHFEKGFVRLMEAFSKVNAPDWKLVIVGVGVHELEIKNKAVELGLADRVLFLGKVKEIDELLSKCRIFVLASHWEGFPNALCEGMAAGLACISFDIVAGPRDIIKNGINGYLIEDGNIELLSEKMQFLIDHPDIRLKLGSEALKIIDEYNINEIGDAYLDFMLNGYGERTN